jgi:putative inorganic carbon (HCO3(-)) transporter
MMANKGKLTGSTAALIVVFIAVAMGGLMAKNLLAGMGVFGFVLGLAVIVACLLNTETGFYINLIYCFFVYQVNRMFFSDDLPVGIMTDVLSVAMLFSFFAKGISLKTSFNQFFRSPIVILVILNFFYGSLEIFNPEGHSFEAWLQAIRRAFETFVILFVVFQILKDRESIRRYIRVVFVLCCLVALYGCIQQWHGLFGFEQAWAAADPIRFGLLFINGEFRIFSTFNDPTAFGTTMAVCSVFFTILAISQRDKRIKWTLLCGVLLMLLAMAYSGTRTANVMLVAGFGMFALLTINKKSTRIFAVIGGFLFAVVIYAPIYGNNTINRFRSSFAGSNDESYKVRIMSRNFIQPYMQSHPFGGGLGTTGNLGLKLNPGHFLAGFQTDSGYVQLALEIGWLGLALTCILFFLVLKGGLRGYFHCRDEEIRPVYAAGTCAIFCYYVGMFAQNTLGNLTDMALYYPVIAMILRLKNYNSNADKV